MDIIWVSEFLFAERNDKGEFAFLDKVEEKNPNKFHKAPSKPKRCYTGNPHDPLEQYAMAWEVQGYKEYEIASMILQMMKERSALLEEAFRIPENKFKRVGDP